MLALLLLVTAPTTDKKMADAEKVYDDGQFARAAKLFEAVLAANPPSSKMRQNARLLLGFSRYWAGDGDRARAVLRELLRENPDFPVDPSLHHPELVKLFEGERKAYQDSIAPPPVPASAPAPKQDVVAKPVVEAAAEIKTTGDRYPGLRILPLGIGQFVNHDRVGGAIFLSLELALVAANVTAAIIDYRLEVAPGEFLPGALEARWVQNITGITAVVVAVIGIIDAFVWSPARGRTSLASERTAINLGPLGDYVPSFVLITR